MTKGFNREKVSCINIPFQKHQIIGLKIYATNIIDLT